MMGEECNVVGEISFNGIDEARKRREKRNENKNDKLTTQRRGISVHFG